jgi:hypothetical protein
MGTSIPPLTDRAAGAVLAALLCEGDRATDVLNRLPGVASEAARPYQVLCAASVEERDRWVAGALGVLTADPSPEAEHVHCSWIESALAASPGAGLAIARDPQGTRTLVRNLLGHLPSRRPLPAPLDGIEARAVEKLCRALAARRVAVALLPAGRIALAEAASRMPAPDGALVIAAAGQGAAQAEAGEDAREAIGEVRTVLTGGGDLARLGVRRLAGILVGLPAALELAKVALPMPLGLELDAEVSRRSGRAAGADRELGLARRVLGA